MIITKAPFRVSFAGGGSDMAPFYEKYGGCMLSTSINKYMYISIHPYFDEGKTLLKYSENELVNTPPEIRHTIFRQVLTDMRIHGVEISSTADVPGGTGPGSSSTFTVGLLHTLFCYQGKYVSNVLNAVEYAKEQGNRVIGLTGLQGGKLKQLADISLHVPVQNLQITEDVHLVFNHLMMWVLGRTLS